MVSYVNINLINFPNSRKLELIDWLANISEHPTANHVPRNTNGNKMLTSCYWPSFLYWIHTDMFKKLLVEVNTDVNADILCIPNINFINTFFELSVASSVDCSFTWTKANAGSGNLWLGTMTTALPVAMAAPRTVTRERRGASSGKTIPTTPSGSGKESAAPDWVMGWGRGGRRSTLITVTRGAAKMLRASPGSHLVLCHSTPPRRWAGQRWVPPLCQLPRLEPPAGRRATHKPLSSWIPNL